MQTNPHVTISLNMHRTHPNNLTDAVSLKNLLKSVGTSKVLTDLQEIFQDSPDGRGELLIIKNHFS